MGRSVNEFAEHLEARLTELHAEKTACACRSERRVINQKIHAMKDLLRWTKTRTGYDPTPQDLGLL